MKLSALRFLGTFNTPQASPPAGDPAPAPAPVAAVPAAAAPAPVVVPVVIDLQAAQAARANAQQQVQQARQNAPNEEPAPPANTTSEEETRALRRSVDANTRELRAMKLETYRLNAINKALASGVRLVESLVGGRNEAEIDASIALATAEYALVQQRVLAEHQSALQSAPAAATPAAPTVTPAAPITPAPAPAPQQAAPVVPQGVSTSVAAPEHQQVQAYAQPASPSLPSFASPAPVPAGGQQVITQEHLAYLTSPEAIRNGDYQKNRHLLHGALRGSGVQAPPRDWSLNGQGQQLAPPLPPTPGAPAVQHHNVFSGVTMPHVQPAGPMPIGAPHRGAPPSVSFTPPAARPYGAPQPGDLQNADGSRNGVQVDPAAARAAAEAAIAARRPQ